MSYRIVIGFSAVVFLLLSLSCSSSSPEAPEEAFGIIHVSVDGFRAEAPWHLEGPNTDYDGVGNEELLEMSTGTYTITWGEVDGYTSPNPNPVEGTLSENQILVFTGTYDFQLGMIEVDVEPDNLTTSWTLAGPEDFTLVSQGDSALVDMPVGQYSINWGDVPGWITPMDANELLASDGVISFQGVYIQQAGTITVDIAPGSIEPLASWTLMGPEDLELVSQGDSTFVDMPIGEYSISWNDVAGWIAPEGEIQILTDEGAITFLGEYVQQAGTITIDVAPGSVEALATWTLGGPNDYAFTSQGDSTLVEMPVGEYSISWSEVAGWITPDGATDVLSDEGTVNFLGEYIPQAGTITVDVTPGSVETLAWWTLTGPEDYVFTSQGDSTLVEMPVGEYSISWGELPGWNAPDGGTEILSDEGSIDFLGEYMPQVGTVSVDVTPGSVEALASWTLTGPGDYVLNSQGDRTLMDMPVGEYGIAWGELAGWVVPGGGNATLTDGSEINFVGEYVQQTGSITVDVAPISVEPIASWTLTGPGDYALSSQGDSTLMNMPVGDYSVSWGDVAGWTSPEEDSQELTYGGSVYIPGIYVEEGPYVPAETTKIIPPEETEVIQDFHENGNLALDGASAYAAGVEVGDILIGQDDDVAYNGFLRKVTSVQRERDNLVLQTEPAALMEAFESLHISEVLHLRPSDIRSSSFREGVSLSPDRDDELFILPFNCVLYDVDGNHSTTYDQIRLTGSYSFNVAIPIVIDLGFFHLDKFEISLETDTVADVGLSAGLDWTFADESFNLATMHLGVIPVAGVVYLVPTLSLDAHIRGDLTIAIETSITYTEHLQNGFGWEEGDYYLINESNKNFEYTPPHLTAELDFETGPALSLACLIYGVAGPYVQNKLGFHFDAEVGFDPCDPDLRFGLDARLYAVTGISCDVDLLWLHLDHHWDFLLYSHDIGDWILDFGRLGTIYLDPNPDPINAPWTLSGPCGFNENSSGDEGFSELLSGGYEVNWGSVSGYTTPASESQTLDWAGTLTFTGDYIEEEDPPACSVSPTSLDFGSVDVDGAHSDRSFTISNVGGGTLSGSVSESCDHYSITLGSGSYSLGAGASHSVTVRFDPSAAGTWNCTISTGSGCEDIGCSGVGVAEAPPSCNVNPTSLNFGSVDVDGGYSDRSFTITNTGGGTLSGSVSESCGDYTILSGGGSYNLGAGASRSVTMRFDPIAAGTRTCTISTGTSCADVGCSGVGVAEAPPSCYVTPTSLNFGSVDVDGGHSDRSFTITNVGGGILSGSVSESCGDYSIISGSGSYSLGAGASRSVTVRFNPSSAGTKTCTISTGTSCANVNCSGVGVGGGVPDGMVLLDAGSFTMGAPSDELGTDFDERPQHSVTLTHDFYLQVSEVTNQQYRDVAQWAYNNGYASATSASLKDNLGSTQELLDMDDDHCEISFSGGVLSVDAGKEDHPVKEVTWYGSAAYCDWLSLQVDLPRAYDHATWQCNGNNPYTASGFRLPTEAEWEYACRAGSSTAFANGPIANTECNDPVLEQIGWYCGNAGGWTHSVGQKIPNAWDLFDMHGNLIEWCNDWYQSDYYSISPSIDPVGPPDGSSRVVRGGGWGFNAQSCRSASRRGVSQGGSYHDFGFRPARSAD